MQKKLRQNAITELIRSKEIGTQEELSELLDKKGISVTQSSVSRDLVELGIVKVQRFYALPETRGDTNIFGLKQFGNRRR